MEMWLDLHRIVYALSDALDLVGIDDVAHGKRVAFMACRAGELMGLAGGTSDDLLVAALFHDCGVSSDREHRNLAGGMDWAGEGSHCERGATLVSEFSYLAHLSPVIRWHHTHSATLETMDLPEDVKTLANLVYIADRVDVLSTKAGGDVLMSREEVCRTVRLNLGVRFRKDIGEALLEASQHEEFWLTLDPRPLGHWLSAQTRKPSEKLISLSDLETLGAIFATIVDAKSPYTAEHSQRVAGVTRVLGIAAGLSDEVSRKLVVAALLHDLGKLRVPDAILDKPRDLDRGEFCVMVRHAYDTWEILNRIEGFDDIARWASFHHEWVRGSGYPFGVGGERLSLESRIVAVSDVFQALRQDRPYRAGMPLAQALSIIDSMVDSGKLDPDVVALLHREINHCDGVATGRIATGIRRPGQVSTSASV